jgi:AraC-like DNA-binding protein
MSYTPVQLERPLRIEQLYTVHYFEYTSSYAFAGESHDFWELLYVDKGSVCVTAGEERFDLGRGQMVFHPPGEFHALSANGVTAPDLVVVSFRCDSPAMDCLRGRVLSMGSEERVLLGRIMQESRVLFSNPLNDPTTPAMTLQENVPFGTAQLLSAAIEELLIRLIRRDETSSLLRQETPRHAQARLAQLTEYLEQRLDQNLTVQQICRDNLIGRAQLERIFREQTGGGVIDYFSKLKIDAARRMIREGQLNITQISTQLGFS